MANIKRGHPVDQHIGARIRLRRSMLKLSQEKLAAAIGLTFQQLQKYESGCNRVSSSRLYELSQVLQVPVAWFFEGYDNDVPPAALLVADSMRCEDPVTDKEITTLVKYFCHIQEKEHRCRVIDIIKVYAKDRKG